MQAAGLSTAAIAAFERSFHLLAANETGLIAEDTIQPAADLPRYEDICPSAADHGDPSLLAKTVMLKLNGGLGTGMGLEKAKSLLPVRDGETFLDLIVRQVLAVRKATGSDLRFLLMNSFSTSADTFAHLRRYSALGDPQQLELLQNKVPKIAADTLTPVAWPSDPDMEWCPPGHGDLYPAILGSGLLQRLLDEGFLYLFVSRFRSFATKKLSIPATKIPRRLSARNRHGRCHRML